MTAKTRSTESSDKPQDVNAVLRNRRVEDELRLRELELQTNFQIQTLTESLNLLKSDFHSWRKSERVVLRETTNPPKEKPEEAEERPRDDSKDPIYGIF